MNADKIDVLAVMDRLLELPYAAHGIAEIAEVRAAVAELIAERDALREALHEGRRAIGDHYAPIDCYATGPMTGNEFRDLVQCPACSFIAMYDAALARVQGGAT